MRSGKRFVRICRLCGGRPRVAVPAWTTAVVFEGISWILWTGAPWSALPTEYGARSTCFRRLQQWEADGKLLSPWRAFLGELHDRQRVKRDECFVDGSFARAKKGGLAVGKTKRGKGTKWMVVADGGGTPLGAYLDSASPAEVRLLESALRTVAVPTKGRPRRYPERLIADRGYDSNAARAWFKSKGVQPIIPCPGNNTQATDQDGRHLRRYAHRWIIERTIEWLGTFRRLVVRYEPHVENYAGLFHMACALLVLRRIMG